MKFIALSSMEENEGYHRSIRRASSAEGEDYVKSDLLKEGKLRQCMSWLTGLSTAGVDLNVPSRLSRISGSSIMATPNGSTSHMKTWMKWRSLQGSENGVQLRHRLVEGESLR